MSGNKVNNPSTSSAKRRIRPAITPEERENQLILLAIDLAEKQLIEGTASSQVITHYLKLGTEREKLEREKLAKEKELLDAKTEAIHAEKRNAEIYAQVLAAMKRYQGGDDQDECEQDTDLYGINNP